MKELLLIVISTAIFYSADFTLGIAIGISIVLVIVIPPFVNIFYLQAKKYKNLPDVDKMPDLILKTNGVTAWEEGFCLDMKDKFNDKKFIENISRKQCRKLMEIYFERVRKIPEKDIDVTEASIYIGDRKIQ
jgi:hypothetical protein